MNKYLDLIQKSKEYIDQGFDTFHRQLQIKDQIGGFLVLCTFRAAGLSDAIVHLCKAGFTDESLPILRSLIETAVNMRWIMNKNREERLKQYYANLAENKWYGEPWTSVNLRDRMKEIGFKGKLELYYDLVVKFCHDYTHGGARTLPRRRLIPKARKTLMSAGAIYAVTSQMLGHVLKALNDHWPGKFDSYKLIWKAIKNFQPPQ
ncbi:hypothetical protein ES703_41236 [subsurface metagenome]